MRSKIIGILVCMLMIATVVPVSGTIQENSVLSTNKHDNWRLDIGFVTHRTFSEDESWVSYDAIFVLEFWQGYETAPRPWFIPNLHHSHEIVGFPLDPLNVKIDPYFGKHFIFFYEWY